MSRYILNKNKQDSSSGENYEVHNEENCGHLPDQENRISLGYFSNCHEAVNKAKNSYPNWSASIDGCYYCCNACNHG